MVKSEGYISPVTYTQQRGSTDVKQGPFGTLREIFIKLT